MVSTDDYIGESNLRSNPTDSASGPVSQNMELKVQYYSSTRLVCGEAWLRTVHTYEYEQPLR
jgi:hypothetical protein